MTRTYKEVGTVKEIYRYPVKSMAGETIAETKLGWHGLAGDRRFAFAKIKDKTGLPWLSARDFSQLILYLAKFSEPSDVERSSIVVQTPGGRQLALESKELRQEIQDAYGDELQLMQLWRGTFDSMPLSLISTTSIKAIGDHIGFDLEVQRFRPNLVIEVFEEKAFPEERWVGELLVFGERDTSARVRANRKDPRCAIVNLDPKNARQNTSVLREIVQNRKNQLGIYGSTERPGTIQIGDVIRLVKD